MTKSQRQAGIQAEIDRLRDLYRPEPEVEDEWPDVMEYVRETTKGLEGSDGA